MNSINFNSQVCTDKVQSERLLALGLKKETADMFYDYCKDRIGYTWYLVPKPATLGDKRSIPAWSLHRLIEMIQDVCSRIIMVHSWVRIENRCMPFVDYPCDSFENSYDNLFSCIEWLI